MKVQRSTKQRSLVFRAVQEHKDHPTADQIYLEVRERDPTISRGTVYRNLNLLTKNSQVRHVKMPGVDRFDWRIEPHYHLLCTGCGKVYDVPVPYHAELDKELSERSGFEVTGHSTTFEGLCPDCRNAARTTGK